MARIKATSCASLATLHPTQPTATDEMARVVEPSQDDAGFDPTQNTQVDEFSLAEVGRQGERGAGVGGSAGGGLVVGGT